MTHHVYDSLVLREDEWRKVYKQMLGEQFEYRGEGLRRKYPEAYNERNSDESGEHYLVR
jgi:hypothetical protein